MSLTIRFGQGAPQYGGPLDTRIRAAIRHCIADEIERLMGILDAIEPDPDLEASISWAGATGYGPNPQDPFPGSEAEDDAGDDREQDDDREPTLGWAISGAFGDITVWDEVEREEWR